MKKLKILANIPRYDYGKKELGDSFEYDTFYTFFKNSGHIVDLFDYTTIYNLKGKDRLQKKLIDTVTRKQYDIVFTVPFTDQYSLKTLKTVMAKHTGAYSIAWMCDDKWRWENFSKHFAHHFDYIITTDPDAVDKYKQIGHDNIILSQWAHNPAVYKKISLPKILDVSFVGGISPWREYVINKLKKAGIEVMCFGNGWENGRVSVQDIVKIYNSSKLVLNLSNSTKFDLAFMLDFKPYKKYTRWQETLAHSFPGLIEFVVSQKRKEDIKARFFEVTATGSTLLSYNVDYLDSYLTPDKEILIYTDINDLITKIKHSLLNEDLLQLVGKNGYQRTHIEHTYKRRFDDIFKQMGIV